MNADLPLDKEDLKRQTNTSDATESDKFKNRDRMYRIRISEK